MIDDTMDDRQIKKYTSIIHHNTIIKPMQIHYFIKETENMGNGIFVKESISNGTDFLLIPEECIGIDINSDEYQIYEQIMISHLPDIRQNGIISMNINISSKINDLAYCEGTYNLDTIKEHTNIVHILKNNIFQYIPLCFRSIKDIKTNDQLSKIYGIEFWKDYEFWKRRETCKWKDTKLDEDLPDDYIEIDRIRHHKETNESWPLYAKKIGDKYFYKSSYNIWHFDTNKSEYIDIDISLLDNKMKPIDEYITIRKIDTTKF